jgi:hypothetical protein
MDPKLIQAALDALIADDKEAAIEILKKLVVASAGGDPAAGDPPPPEELGATGDNAETPPEELAALSRELVTLSGRATAGEAVAYFRELHASSTATAADRARLEASERRGLVTELVRLGVERPARAWVRDADGNIPEGDARTPVARLANEPIVELRERVAELRAERGGDQNPSRGARPPAEKPKLSKAELDYCTREKITPEDFAARKAGAVKRSS